MELIVTGKTLNGKKALKLGLADAMVPSSFKHDALMALIKTKKLKKKRLNRSFLEYVPWCRVLIKRKVRKSILKKTNGHYPAPIKALDGFKDLQKID